MTDISSFVVSVIVSNRLVTYVTIKLYKIIPLRTIEYSYSQIYHVTDFYLLVFMEDITIRLKICMGSLSVLILDVTNVTFEGHDIC